MTHSSTTQSPDLWFELPAGFTQIDLDEPSDERTMRLAEAIDLMFDAAPEQKLAAVLSCQYGIDSMVKEGAVHLSHCLLRTDEGFTQGMLTLFIQPGDCRDRRLLTERTVVQWRSDSPAADVSLVDLPYGPAVVAAEEKTNRTPGVMYGVAEDQISVVRQLRVAIPLFSGDKTALFVFSTEDVENWEHYVRIMVNVMRSVSPVEPRDDNDPGATNADAEPSASAEAMRADFG